MKGSQGGVVRTYVLDQDVEELGLQFYKDGSAGGTAMAAFLCQGNPGESEVWIGTNLTTGKAGDAIAFERGGTRPCQVAGGIGSVPQPLKLGADGKLVTAGAVGDNVIGQLPEPLTGDGTAPVELHVHAINQGALPPSLGG